MIEENFGKMTVEEVDLVTTIYKRVMLDIYEGAIQFEGNEKQFEATMVVLGVVISNFLSIIGINDLNDAKNYLENFNKLILYFHKSGVFTDKKTKTND